MGCTSSTPVKEGYDPNRPMPAKKLTDSYVLHGKLGVGASCSVVSAVRKGAGEKKKFAIKILKKDPSAANDNEFLFKNEVAIMSRLQHPNIVEYVEAFEDEHTYNLVTVMCAGGELFDRVSEGSFSERAASGLTRQMLLALAHCHARNITHRDLKPENFVFEGKEPTANMKLIDFGCAVHAADDQVIRDVAGSPYYVAPEVLVDVYKRTGKVWKAADMWSIGVIVFLLVHGYPPFNGDSQDQIFHKIRMGKYRFSKDITLSPGVKDFIGKLLVMDPAQRMTAQQALEHPWIAQYNKVSDTPFSKNVIAALGDFRSQYRLKKAVAKAIARSMSDEDEKQLAGLFKQFDKNGDGTLDASEIAAMMKHLGKSPVEAKEFMNDFDENNDGKIDKEEFKTLYGMSKLSNADDIKAMFKKFDTNGDGIISQDEILAICGTMAPDVAKALIQEVDKNGDGRINFAEWLVAMTALNKGKATVASANVKGIKF